jgi:hypothetical protein
MHLVIDRVLLVIDGAHLVIDKDHLVNVEVHPDIDRVHLVIDKDHLVKFEVHLDIDKVHLVELEVRLDIDRVHLDIDRDHLVKFKVRPDGNANRKADVYSVNQPVCIVGSRHVCRALPKQNASTRGQTRPVALEWSFEEATCRITTTHPTI